MKNPLGWIFNRLTIGIPYLWLIIFFLVPFFIVFKISLSTTAIQMPPYDPVFDGTDTWTKLQSLTFDNYIWLTEEALYYKAYLSSVLIAGAATFLTLLVAYPLAYGMARAPSSLRPTLLMLVILPFWTSFLIRVYAWIGILKDEGLLNQLLMSIGIISEPLHIMQTHTAIFYRHRLFLPAVHGAADLFGAGKDGLFADRSRAGSRLHADFRLLENNLPAIATGRDCRMLPRFHSGNRRIRDSGFARRVFHIDDRQNTVE